jgi:hypothetical protein
MKSLALGTLLTLALVACSTPNEPSSQKVSPTPLANVVGNTLTPDAFTSAQLEGMFGRAGLARAGNIFFFSASLKPDAVNNAMIAYNVNLPSVTGCTVDWGDGTPVQNLTCPTVASPYALQAHRYDASGDYTITLCAKAGATIVQCGSRLVKGLTRAIDFEDAVENSQPAEYNKYGYKLKAKSGALLMLGPNFGTPVYRYKSITAQTLGYNTVMVLARADGQPFSLLTYKSAPAFGYTGGGNYVVRGFKSDNTTIEYNIQMFDTDRLLNANVKVPLNWKDLLSVEFIPLTKIGNSTQTDVALDEIVTLP